MSLSEFSIIETYFTQRAMTRHDVSLGIGDDAAILDVPGGMQLVATTDTLVEGIHFHAGTAPSAVGYKSLAVNLSDLAAMGAEPAWVTLSLCLPEADAGWLEDFSRGFLDLAEKHGVQLVGGDTVQGPLSVTVQAMGFIPAGSALRRDAAQPGDRIYVTGTLGDAAIGLRLLREDDVPPAVTSALVRRLEYPEPRTGIGSGLRGIAHAAIDISDGLVGDLGHILERSGTGATIHLDRLPLSDAFPAGCAQLALEPDSSAALEFALAGGDDYELCFTVPPERIGQLQALDGMPVAFTEIGVIEPGSGLRCVAAGGQPVELAVTGYRHFSRGLLTP